MSGKEFSFSHFGILIVYVIPGFTALRGLTGPTTSLLAQEIGGWEREGTLAGFLYGTVAAITAGLIVSAVRWLVIDTLHHHTGLRRPVMDFETLDKNVAAFEFLVQSHYWFFQFYGNMVIALIWAFSKFGDLRGPMACEDGLLLVLFFLASRDALRKYYDRAGSLLRPRTNPAEAVLVVPD